MPALPSASSFTGSGVTQADVKTQLTNLISFLSGLLDTPGTAISALQKLGALGNAVLAKSAAYIVVAADRGKLIDCSGTWTLSLTAAATLGNGFAFAVRNSGSGTITIDPNLSEQIDGATTIALAAGESCIVVCDGAKFSTIGKATAPVAPAIRQVVSTTIPAATGTTTIPDDNTPPLSTEGTQIASLTIKPSSASNKVRLRVSLSAIFADSGSAAVGNGILAVFRGATLVGSVRTGMRLIGSSDTVPFSGVLAVEFEDAPGAIVDTVYSVRIGLYAGAAWYVNRSIASATALGSSMANSRFTAEELSA